MPQSRHRKINPRKKQREQRAKSSHGPSLASNRNVKIGAIILVAVLALVTVAYFLSLRNRGATDYAAAITTPSGLKYIDEKVGEGPSPKPGQTVTVNYVGVTQSTRTEIDNSYKKGGPVDFTLGVGGLIPGWEEGLSTMKVGGKRKLIIPGELGYGPRGKPPVIPPNATLEFDIELLGIK